MACWNTRSAGIDRNRKPEEAREIKWSCTPSILWKRSLCRWKSGLWKRVLYSGWVCWDTEICQRKAYNYYSRHKLPCTCAFRHQIDGIQVPEADERGERSWSQRIQANWSGRYIQVHFRPGLPRQRCMCRSRISFSLLWHSGQRDQAVVWKSRCTIGNISYRRWWGRYWCLVRFPNGQKASGTASGDQTGWKKPAGLLLQKNFSNFARQRDQGYRRLGRGSPVVWYSGQTHSEQWVCWQGPAPLPLEQPRRCGRLRLQAC